jgi:hypothetical protein
VTSDPRDAPGGGPSSVAKHGVRHTVEGDVGAVAGLAGDLGRPVDAVCAALPTRLVTRDLRLAHCCHDRARAELDLETIVAKRTSVDEGGRRSLA